MTRDEFTNRLPEYTSDAFTLSPPFNFNGLSSRIFPLRANLEVLQQVCDGYLNIAPPEAGYFRAFLPYVFLMMIDYGQMADPRMSGWIAQTEVFFSVPVEWYQMVDGQWVFHDWAVITPYIFVNDNFSMPLGRSAFGFPKVLAKVTNVESNWLKDPVAPLNLARFETEVFPDAYQGMKLEMRTFLEVECKGPISSFGMPADMNQPLTPWSMASNLASAMGGFGRDAQWLAESMGMFPAFRLGWTPDKPEGARSPATLQQMMAAIMPMMMPGGPAFTMNSINLKQLRRNQHPERACFQALTNAGMRVIAFNGSGLLGGDRTLFSDLSGGHTIRLFEHSSLPIARTLGLEVHRRWKSNDVGVAELQPVIPFWANLDCTMEKGYNIAWRKEDGIWREDTGAAYDPSQKPAQVVADEPKYNTTVSTALEAITGPFTFAGTTIRVLPLLARLDALQTYVDGYLNNAINDPDSPVTRKDKDGKVVGEEKVRFQVWARPPLPRFLGGAMEINPESAAEAPKFLSAIGGQYGYVYLTASSFGTVTSGTNNVGDWAKHEMSFMIPVKWERWNAEIPNPKTGQKGDWEIAGVGMVPAFTMMDDCVAANSRIEVLGIDASVGTFIRPEHIWLSGDGGDFRVVPEQPLLRGDAEVMTAVGTGQKGATQPLIEISTNVPDQGFTESESRDLRWLWAEILRLELGAKNAAKSMYPERAKVARALSLELLGNQSPFSIYTMKQLRDVTDPGKACYQSVVRVSRELKEVFDIREIEDTLLVRFHDYPSLSIVKTLGIVAGKSPASGSGVIYGAQAIRPFYIRATIEEPLAERILWRAGEKEWTLEDYAFRTLLSDNAGGVNDAPDLKVNRTEEKLMDQMDPCQMSRMVFKNLNTDSDISKEDAHKAVKIIDPQMVIESILSREWGNLDDNCRWRKGRNDLLERLKSLSQGGPLKAAVEAFMYVDINNGLSERPGAVASPLRVTDLKLMRDDPTILKIPPDPSAKPPRPSAAEKWQDCLNTIIASEFYFTAERVKMEELIEYLAPLDILGNARTLDLYNQSREKGAAVITVGTLVTAAHELLQLLEVIRSRGIEGQPSGSNPLAPAISAASTRFGELLDHLKSVLMPDGKPWPEEEYQDRLVDAETHGQDFRDLVALARRYCDAQLDALLNKLSRAYQKPDFCIYRPSLGSAAGELLRPELSWDQDWYTGMILPLKDQDDQADPKMTGGIYGDS